MNKTWPNLIIYLCYNKNMPGSENATAAWQQIIFKCRISTS